MKILGRVLLYFFIVCVFHYHPESWFISDTFTLMEQRVDHQWLPFLMLHWDAHFMPLYRAFFDIEYRLFGLNAMGYFVVSYFLQAVYGTVFFIWLREIEISKKRAFAMSLVLLTAHNSATIIYWHIAQGIIFYGILSVVLMILIEKYLKLQSKKYFIQLCWICALGPLMCAEGILVPLYAAVYFALNSTKRSCKSLSVHLFTLLALSFLPYILLGRIMFPIDKPLTISWDLLLTFRFMVVGLINGIFYQFQFVKYCIPEGICYVVCLISSICLWKGCRRVDNNDKRRVLSLLLFMLMTIGAVSLGRQDRGVYQAIKPFYHYFTWACFLGISVILFRQTTGAFLMAKLKIKPLALITVIVCLFNFVSIKVTHEKYWVRATRIAHEEKRVLDTLLFPEIKKKQISYVPNVSLSAFMGKIKLHSYLKIFYPELLPKVRMVSLSEYIEGKLPIEPIIEKIIPWHGTVVAASTNAPYWKREYQKKESEN